MLQTDKQRTDIQTENQTYRESKYRAHSIVVVITPGEGTAITNKILLLLHTTKSKKTIELYNSLFSVSGKRSGDIMWPEDLCVNRRKTFISIFQNE